MAFIKKGNVRLDERNVRIPKGEKKNPQPPTKLKTSKENPYVSKKG